jgi:hypothetical protein
VPATIRSRVGACADRQRPGAGANGNSPYTKALAQTIIAPQRFAGVPTPVGEDWASNIKPAGLGFWSKDNIAWSGKVIASFLEDGQYPGGDYAGGAMADVTNSGRQLSRRKRAIVYLVVYPSSTNDPRINRHNHHKSLI